MSRSVATVERDSLVGHLRTNWKRSRLSTFTLDITVDDPGHGLDDISPVIYLGQIMDPDSDESVSAISPFSARDLRGFSEGSGVRLGTGWLVVAIEELRESTIIPGERPIKMADTLLKTWIASPADDGPETADNYSGALGSIFESQFFEPGEAGVEEIRQTGPLPQRAIYLGDDDKGWSWHQLGIPLKRIRKASSQPTPGG